METEIKWMKPSKDVTGMGWKICHEAVSTNENTMLVKVSVMTNMYSWGVGLNAQKNCSYYERVYSCKSIILIIYP